MRQLQSFEGHRVSFKPSRFLQSISRHSRASPCGCIVALLYIERIRARYPSVVLTSKTMQRLLLVALMTAMKNLEDFPRKNDFWCVRLSIIVTCEPATDSARRRADIGGIELEELNALEQDFLSALDFRLSVCPSEYIACTVDLLRFAAGLIKAGCLPGLERLAATSANCTAISSVAQCGQGPAIKDTSNLSLPSPTRDTHSPPPIFLAPLSPLGSHHFRSTR